MSKREIKKTIITYGQEKVRSPSRQRSREKTKVEIVDSNSRRARLAAMKKRDQQPIDSNPPPQQIKISMGSSNQQQQPGQKMNGEENQVVHPIKQVQKKVDKAEAQKDMEDQFEQQEGDEEEGTKVLMKPIFISKQERDDEGNADAAKDKQRKKKAMRYTTKMLLIENAKADAEEDEEVANSSDQQIRTDLPDDNDQVNEEFEYEQWKVRELKRIRRDREERRKLAMQKAEIERRRKMNNEEILLQNKVMGSDATENATETKYVYMQKYYHKGAFYQDSEDPIFKRDYNLPTPLEMQDKSMLPEILQRRQGKFGSKGQSKYKHLTAEDTSNFDPQFRPDESILANWKKKTGGYKGAERSNI